MEIYRKLVRDKIIDIIKADGKNPDYTLLSRDSFKFFAEKKLGEEIEEYRTATTIDDRSLELADILEIVYALAKNDGISEYTLNNIRLKKLQERGAFDERIFLVSVQD